MSDPTKYRFAIDRGGTFTDIYAEVPGEEGFMVEKLLSEDPENYADAPREGIRRVIEKVSNKKLPRENFDTSEIEWIRMGTTVATNALLERAGEPCVLVTTKGFKDILRIGYQNRPRLFDLKVRKTRPISKRVIEVQERVRLLQEGESTAKKEIRKGTTGEKYVLLHRLDREATGRQLREVYDQGIRSLAIVLIHGYNFPEHERIIAEIAHEIGFPHISLSSEVVPRIKIVARGDTTLVDAYLNPHIQNYIDSFRNGFQDNLSGTPLFMMQSNGGLTTANHFSGSKAILSGPAGGVVGFAMTAFNKETNQPVIGFDMGGTSTDVSRFSGEFELIEDVEIDNIRIQAPQLNIKTVAAGGGSRLFFRDGLFLVGPESSGAHPGPVCYRKNGYLSITDANLFLGRLLPDFFPKIFGKDEKQPLDYEATVKAFRQITNEVNRYNRSKEQALFTEEEVAQGFIRVANETMVRAIREISVHKGYDTREHILATFGGAGGQHACAIARTLGISKIFIHRFAGILSAYGLGMADVTTEEQEPSSFIYSPKINSELKARFIALEDKVKGQLEAQGFQPDNIHLDHYLHLRFRGTDTAIMVSEEEAKGRYDKAFREIHQREFGFDLRERDILVDDIRVRGFGKTAQIRPIPIAQKKEPPTPLCQKKAYFDEGWITTSIFDLTQLGAGQEIQGPAIIIHDTSTIVIEPQCFARITDRGDIEIKIDLTSKEKVSEELNPITLSIFSNLFMSVAEQMGSTLQRTAISTNIKERSDFSCALFDQEGNLVANAPHQPVHLGSIGEAIKHQIQLRKGQFQTGTVIATNHPSFGGTHLPDITVITPLLREGKPVFFVASRGHHGDIGGVSPGSMPPFSRELWEEGICLSSLDLVKEGVFQEEEVMRVLSGAPLMKAMSSDNRTHGTRTLSDNISDLKAQIAANWKGVKLLSELIEHYSESVVVSYMQHIQRNAEETVRERLKELSREKNLHSGECLSASDFMDDGSKITLSITIDADKGDAVFDFSGTGLQVWGNTNAPESVTKSAIIYCLRSIVNKDIPLNQGCLNPVKVIIPEGSLLSPSENAGVAGGNVLTSQRVVDVIFKAFGIVAASQGCMNNFTFGNDNFGYYETIAGGAGAGNGWDGESAVHTHMTNTKITDPEVLEKRYPVVLHEFSIRNHSGGEGKYQGGDGVVREIEFLQKMQVAILSERRVYAPYGLQGGKNGKKGENLLLLPNARPINLGGKSEVTVEAGTRIRINTPGGGGFGQK